MQSFSRSLLYKAYLISPIPFVMFLSLMLAKSLLSTCSVISPANSPFMMLHTPLDNANQIFLQLTSTMMLPLASSISHYLRGASSQHNVVPLSFNSNMSHHIHMGPFTRL